MGGLQRLLWPDRVAASLGELPADFQHGAAATEAFGAQQTLWRGPSRGKTNLQPLPLSCFLAIWALDPGMNSETRRLFTKSQHYLTTRLQNFYLHFLSGLLPPPFLWTVSLSFLCGLPLTSLILDYLFVRSGQPLAFFLLDYP